jgi:hypothetical protein
MPTTEERLASLEARMERTQHLVTLVEQLRSDMNRQFADMNRQFTEVRAEAHRDFKWIIGIQLTIMAAVIGALVSVVSR